MNKLSDELFKKIQNFETKYADILIKWLTLVKKQKVNFAWRPDNHRDLYAMKLYEISKQHDNALSTFEQNVDKNILLTWLKYHNYNREQITYPFSFNYSEPKIDLVLNPQK